MTTMTTTDDAPSQVPRPDSTADSTPPTMPEEPTASSEPSVPPRTTSLSPAAQPAAAPNEPTQTEGNQDPNVVALQGMFPDFDYAVLQSVLESVGGDQDKAIDILLGMSDPSYSSTAMATARDDVAAQTALDEEFARTLLLEESEQHNSSWRPNDPQRLPYRPRADVPHHRPQPERQGSEGDGMAQFQEQIGKFAETGKRTFTTLFSKVKAKIQEFDSPSGSQSQPQAHHPLPHGDAWSTPAQSQAYYDPNPPLVQGYEVNVPGPISNPSSTAPARSPPAASSSPPPAAVGPITSNAPGANTVDPAKIGLLPKRPISLGSSPQPSKTGDEDDDIEYVENPFEETSRK